jgi:dTDP-4-amino-4,6-dideoxy-D-galactose acyltransferase
MKRMAATDQAPCEILEWDTDFFGFRVARVHGDTLTQARVQQIDAWCRQTGVRCLYFLGRPDDVNTSRLAQDNDFQMVDIRMTFEHKNLDAAQAIKPHAVVVRPAHLGDVPPLKDIVRDSYHDTRFYFDDNFPRQLCASLYETWIQVSCEGYADVVLAAELDGKVAGYISCHLDEASRSGNIGLIGVANQAQGRGLGQTLVLSALEWFLAQGMQKVLVVTQGRNLAAQRLYQRCGFLTQSVQLWYHKWYTEITTLDGMT